MNARSGTSFSRNVLIILRCFGGNRRMATSFSTDRLVCEANNEQKSVQTFRKQTQFTEISLYLQLHMVEIVAADSVSRAPGHRSHTSATGVYAPLSASMPIP